MEKSAKFNTVKTYFSRGLWDAKKVGNAVAKGWITAEEYKEITGEEFSE